MKKKNKILAIFAIAILIFFFISFSASALSIKDAMSNIAQTGNVSGYNQNVTFTDIVALIINTLLGIIGIIFFIMIIYGGLTWMTAAGNPEKVGKAKKLITNAIIGLAIITAAYSISYFITTALESTPT